MKNIALLLSIVFQFAIIELLSAQDIIYKTDGTEINAKVIEIDESTIKYKNFDQQEGPIRSISKSTVFLIKYKEGTVEKFVNANTGSNLNQNPNSNFNSGKSSVTSDNTFTDSRDGKIYKIVIIGDQTWFAENLNFQFGTSWCYGDDLKNCEEYGRLYDWETALVACPEGWQLPSDDNWAKLMNFFGSEKIAYNIMKESGALHWKGKSSKATNESGFTALPSGIKDFYDGYGGQGICTAFWSSTEWQKKTGMAYYIGNDLTFAYHHYYLKKNGHSVRCIKK